MPRSTTRRVPYSQWVKLTPKQQASKRRSMGIPSISGRGAYKTKSVAPKSKYSYSKPGPVGRLGRAAGRAAGNMLGGPAGGFIGEKLGGLSHYIGKIFGSGDYTSSPPVEQNTIISPQVPSFASGGATIRVKHREYLGDVYSSPTANTFDINSYRINPGLSATFPWLSQVCGSTFQQYRLNGMVFEYRSMSGDALTSSNTALGTVVMCTDYDSADAPFTSKQQMENTEFGVSCKPSTNMIHAIECAPQLTSVNEKYIRAYNAPSNTDIRLYDMGRFYIATNGFQGTNVNCGELWVSYDVTLIKAIEQPPAYLNGSIHYNLAGTDPLRPMLLDTSVNAVQPVFNTLSAKPVTTATTIVLPLTLQATSKYLLIYMVRGASTINCAPPAITLSGGLTGGFTPLPGPFINGASGGFMAPQAVAGNMSTTIVNCASFTYNGTGTLALPPTITFGTTGIFPATPQGGDVHIIQLNNNLR